MVKHVILWTLRKDLSPEDKQQALQNIKSSLEALQGQVPGLLDIKVIIHHLPTTNVDAMLDSTLESAAALEAYATHPAHVAAADTYVRPFTAERRCIDYEI